MLQLLPVRQFVCPIWAPDLKTKRFRKTRICTDIPQSKSNQCANFQLERSKVKVTVHQQPQENEAYLAYVVS